MASATQFANKWRGMPLSRLARGIHRLVVAERISVCTYGPGRALPGGWTFLVGPTKPTVVRSSGDPDRLDFAAALRRGTRA